MLPVATLPGARGRGYRVARALSSIGLLMIVVLFMGGFIAIGGEWFQMWRSTAWNGEDAALRNAILALVSLVLVHLPSAPWRTPPRGPELTQR
jgi:predicted small integral membrane protein